MQFEYFQLDVSSIPAYRTFEKKNKQTNRNTLQSLKVSNLARRPEFLQSDRKE